MRKIREVLRLKAAGKSHRQIALSVGVGQSTVGDYLSRARRAGVSAHGELDDAALERALYPPTPAMRRTRSPLECGPGEELPSKVRQTRDEFAGASEICRTHPNGTHFLKDLNNRPVLPVRPAARHARQEHLRSGRP